MRRFQEMMLGRIAKRMMRLREGSHLSRENGRKEMLKKERTLEGDAMPEIKRPRPNVKPARVWVMRRGISLFSVRYETSAGTRRRARTADAVTSARSAVESSVG